MNRIRRFCRLAGALTGLAIALVAALAGAPAAFAAVNPPPGPLSRLEPVAPVVPAHTHAPVTWDVTGWQIALIAVGAAIAGAIVAVLLDRTRARRHLPATAT
jgi:hypothetical protein